MLTSLHLLLKIILHSEEKRVNFHQILDKALKQGIPENEQKLFSRLFFEYFRKKITLERLLKNYISHRPDQNTETMIKIGALLLLEWPSLPDYAVDNELVNATATKNKKLVNAVLRKVSLRKDEIYKEIGYSPDLSYKYSQHKGYIKELKKLSPEYESLLCWLDRQPIFQIFPFLPAISLDELINQFEKAKITFSVNKKISCIQVEEVTSLRKIILQQTPCFIQNSASQLISRLAATFFKPDLIYLDIASAPGTKSIALKSLIPEARIIACDLNRKRLELFERQIHNWKINGIQLIQADALKLPLRNKSNYFVIADLPCSSSGTMRKNPDLKSRFNPRHFARLHQFQLETIERLINYFPSSWILYSVCSFLSIETVEVLKKISANYRLNFFSPEDVLLKFGFRFIKNNYGFYLLPSEHENDLFFFSIFCVNPR